MQVVNLIRGGLRWLRVRFSISTKSLAVFRVMIAALVLADLVLRMRNFTYFYLADGVYPYWLSATAELWRGTAMSDVWSVLNYDSIVIAVFILNAVSAVLLLVGWRSRLNAVIMLVCVTLIDMRNGLVLSIADTYLQNLLLFAVFLPLGEMWSVDSKMRDREVIDSVFGVATVGILSQVAFMYFINGTEKLFGGNMNPTTTLKLMIEYDVESYTHAELLNVVPGPVLEALSVIWVGVLFTAPVLLLAQKRHVKSILTIPYILAHAVIAIAFRIGLFPYISIVALLLFIQPQTWDVILKNYKRVNSGEQSLRTINIQRMKMKLKEVVNDATEPNGMKEVGGKWLPTWNNVLSGVLIMLFISGTVVLGGGGTGVDAVDNSIETVSEATGVAQAPWVFFTNDAAFKDTWYVYKVNTSQEEVGDWYNDRPMSIERPYEGSKLHLQYETFREHFYEVKIHRDAFATERRYKARYICDTGTYNGSNIESIEMIIVTSDYNVSNRLSNDRAMSTETIGVYNCSDFEMKN